MESEALKQVDSEPVKIFEASNNERDVLVLAQSALTQPLSKEASRWNTSMRKIILALFASALALATFWIATTSGLRKDVAKNSLVTLRGANRLTVDALGRAKDRLSSKTDSSLYEFLSMHHEAKALSEEESGSNNVVREVMIAIEHESVQAGMTLIIQLFSDLYAAWPKTSFSEKGRKRIKKLVKALEGDPAMKDNLDEIRKGIEEMKEWGDMSGVDEKTSAKLFQTDDPKALARVLRTALYVSECRPFLGKIDRVRMDEFKGKPMGRLELESTKKNLDEEEKKGSSGTPSPTTLFIPSEQNLIKATKVLEELEAFVKDKPELNSLMRSMLFVDLKSP